MSRLAVVTNPRSGQNRRSPAMVETLAALLGDRGTFIAPSDVAGLKSDLAQLREDGVDVLCVNGGDGTLHQVITTLVPLYGDDPLPVIALLRAGTMNIVADSVGVTIGAEEALARVLQAVPTARTSRRLLTVARDDEPPLYGFLSGNGIIARFLEQYYAHPDPTPWSAASLLFRGSMSAAVGGPLIRELTRPYLGSVTVDGKVWDRTQWVAVALGTVRQMGLGFQVFHLLEEEGDQFQVVGIGGTVAGLAAELPSLYRGRGVHREGDRTTLAREVVLESEERIPLMVDGDFYEAHGRVRFSIGPPVTFLLP